MPQEEKTFSENVSLTLKIGIGVELDYNKNMSDHGEIPKPKVVEQLLPLARKIRVLPNEVGYTLSGIDNQSITQAQAVKKNDAFGIILITDGMISFEANKYDLEEGRLYLSSPGLSKRLGKAVVDKASGLITSFSPVIRPGIARELILQSCSPIAKEIATFLPSEEIKPSELNAMREVVDIGENEAVIVDKKGEATILSLNTTSDRSRAVVVSQRKGVTRIQTDNLRYCGAVYVDLNKEFRVLLHGRGYESFCKLLDKCLEMIQRTEVSLSKLRYTLVRSEEGTSSAGSRALYLAYEDYLVEILNKFGRREKILSFDSDSVSVDLNSGTVSEELKRQFKG